MWSMYQVETGMRGQNVTDAHMNRRYRDLGTFHVLISSREQQTETEEKRYPIDEAVMLSIYIYPLMAIYGRGKYSTNFMNCAAKPMF